MSEKTPFDKEVDGYFNEKEDDFSSEIVEKSRKKTNNIDEWKEGSNIILKENNLPYRVENKFWSDFFKFFFILGIFTLIIGFVWGMYNDKFKSNVIQDVVCPKCDYPDVPACPNCNCPSIPSCPEQSECICNPSLVCPET